MLPVIMVNLFGWTNAFTCILNGPCFYNISHLSIVSIRINHGCVYARSHQHIKYVRSGQLVNIFICARNVMHETGIGFIWFAWLHKSKFRHVFKTGTASIFCLLRAIRIRNFYSLTNITSPSWKNNNNRNANQGVENDFNGHWSSEHC